MRGPEVLHLLCPECEAGEVTVELDLPEPPEWERGRWQGGAPATCRPVAQTCGCRVSGDDLLDAALAEWEAEREGWEDHRATLAWDDAGP